MAKTRGSDPARWPPPVQLSPLARQRLEAPLAISNPDRLVRAIERDATTYVRALQARPSDKHDGNTDAIAAAVERLLEALGRLDEDITDQLLDALQLEGYSPAFLPRLKEGLAILDTALAGTRNRPGGRPREHGRSWLIGAVRQSFVKHGVDVESRAGARTFGMAVRAVLKSVGESIPSDLAHSEGRNIVWELRFADEARERLLGLSVELVRANADVIVTGRGTLTAQAAKQATNTIPIVFMGVGDPVGSGLVASLGRPGGNVTGLSTQAGEIAAKSLQLLKEILPDLVGVAVLVNPSSPFAAVALREMRAAAQALRLKVHPVELRRVNDFESGFAVARRDGAGALLALGDPIIAASRRAIVAFAAKNRIPAIYGGRRWVEAGGLISYGVDPTELPLRVATYVDKILKGAKPADLPIEQPTKFDLSINLKTAKALGLTIPSSLVAQADHIIE